MIVALDHIAIAVPDLEKAINRFINDFNLVCTGSTALAAEKTSVAFFPLPETRIELVHPLNEQGPIKKFLEKRGPGLHHICFRTNDIKNDIFRLKNNGYVFLSEKPTIGAHNSKIIFIHPKCCDGVLIELNEPQTTN